MLITPERRGRLLRFVRYAVGSAVATLASAVVFWLAFRLHAGPAVASVAAFLVGAVVNFSANRFWAWQRRLRTGLHTDLAQYAVIAVGTALAAVGVTSAVNHLAPHSALLSAHRPAFVEASYFGTYAAMFLVKFALLDRVVFASRPFAPDRSRDQVEKTTRAYRQP